MENELKPCKKCGEALNIGYIIANFEVDEDYFIYCYNCGYHSKTYRSKAEAIAAWNRRYNENSSSNKNS